jgi:hypothetical protein
MILHCDMFFLRSSLAILGTLNWLGGGLAPAQPAPFTTNPSPPSILDQPPGIYSVATFGAEGDSKREKGRSRRA